MSSNNNSLIGRKIVAIREMTDVETEAAFGQSGLHENSSVLVLDDGTALFASQDYEGNGPGAIFGSKKGEQFVIWQDKGTRMKTCETCHVFELPENDRHFKDCFEKKVEAFIEERIAKEPTRHATFRAWREHWKAGVPSMTLDERSWRAETNQALGAYLAELKKPLKA